MELNRTRRWFYGLTLLWVVMLLGLGSWWLYLVFKLHTQLGSQSRFLNMMKWEGSFFFIFLVLLGASLFYMYFRDMKKSQAMQAFFASLSHELKTPLASMRLQAEVIKDHVESKDLELVKLTKRLIEDTYKLEGELEKSLQLSRVSQDAPLTLVPIGLERYLKKQEQKLAQGHKLHLDIEEGAEEVLADELALNVIFRNLFENTFRHHKEVSKIEIKARRLGDEVELSYDDFGKKFTGDVEKLGRLFYKFNSAKGSGIGLYLIKSLMEKMQGDLKILNHDRLIFQLSFKTPKGEA